VKVIDTIGNYKKLSEYIGKRGKTATKIRFLSFDSVLPLILLVTIGWINTYVLCSTCGGWGGMGD